MYRSSVLFCVVFVIGCGGSVKSPEHPANITQATTERQTRLRALFEAYWAAKLDRHPTWATSIGYHRHDDKLDDYSEEARVAWIDRLKRFRNQLQAIGKAPSLGPLALDANLFLMELTEQIELSRYPGHLLPMAQQQGPHITLPMLLVTHPFARVADYEHYVSRLRAFPTQTDQVIARMREGMRQGVVLPRVIVEQILPQLLIHAEASADQSELAKPLEQMPESFSESEQEEIAGAVRRAVAESVRPAYEKLYVFLRDEYLPASRDTVGLYALPNGKAWYRRLCRHHTTTDWTPEEIHRIGLEELGRIRGRMHKIMKHVGYVGELAAFMAELRTRPDQLASSAQELLDGHAAILTRSDALLPGLFGRLPRAPYVIRPTEAYRHKTAPMARYYPAPRDQTRPAIFYVNTYKPRTRPKYLMEALAYHEAMPGHHLQIALAHENTDLPHFRRYLSVTAFIEGWGLYAESLGKELGGYQDPYSEFGRLTFDAWRASRLVVDTGIHGFGWSRERAIEFLKNNTALEELNIISEVDRYIAWPGQALAYKIGEIAIRELRAKAERELGDRFDVRAFHDALLSEGSLSLDLLKSRMNRWMDRQASTG